MGELQRRWSLRSIWAEATLWSYMNCAPRHWHLAQLQSVQVSVHCTKCTQSWASHTEQAAPQAVLISWAAWLIIINWSTWEHRTAALTKPGLSSSQQGAHGCWAQLKPPSCPTCLSTPVTPAATSQHVPGTTAIPLQALQSLCVPHRHPSRRWMWSQRVFISFPAPQGEGKTTACLCCLIKHPVIHRRRLVRETGAWGIISFFLITEGMSKDPSLDKTGCQGPAQWEGVSQGSVKDGKT